MSLCRLFKEGLSIDLPGLQARGLRAITQWAFLFFSAGWLIAACRPSPFLTPTPDRISMTASSTASHTPTPKPSVTATFTQAATKTPTITPTPSITPTSTEDLSFYDVADCLPKNTTYQRALVTNVVDGDTIEVLLQNGITSTVRYIGIDSPENGYPYFEEARHANSDLVFNKEVVLVKDQSDIDQYQRLLRYVIEDDLFINQDLVREGYAQAGNYPPDEACKETFSSAELEAQQALVGMWVITHSPEPSMGQVIILTVNKREEWVDLQNVGNSAVDLAGWKLVSERGNQDCPLMGLIKAGETLRIWAMTAGGAGYSCRYNNPIWNNSESDPAVLYNAQGVEVSRK